MTDNETLDVLAPPDAMPGAAEALLAVAEHREDPSGAAAPEAAGTAGVVVETRVAVQPDPAAAADQPEADDDYFAGIAWPEGYSADPEALKGFLPVAKRLGLSQESARELARYYAELDMARHGAQAEFVARNNAEWLREIHNHPEFGGRNLGTATRAVGNLLRRFGTPTLTAQMRQMNIQNWPEMFYFLARVAQAQAEDVSPSGQPGQAAPVSTARLLFPGMK